MFNKERELIKKFSLENKVTESKLAAISKHFRHFDSF